MNMLNRTILLVLAAISLTSRAKDCNPNYLQRSIYFNSVKENFNYYPWHTYQAPEGKVKYFQARGPQHIPQICKEAIVYNTVQEVILYKIELEYIEPGFFHSRFIEQVYIQYNKLKRIPIGVFNGTQIRSLVLADNEIEFIENGAFSDMPHLEAIALDYNKIKAFNPDWFEGAKVLYEVSCIHNEITELPYATTRYMTESLDKLGYEYFGSIYFDNNKIRHVHEEAFRNLKNFGTISLSNNEILNIPEKLFRGFEFLLTLYMNTNSFVCFNNRTIQSFTGVKKLFLGNNSMNKDCLERLKTYFDWKNDLVYY
ncbi:unnamed protein product [Phyllotreta striolata]|uniref:Uncharacterized protein n=1 Tax=Phyllotreta striolata TaxID=444603 RepID=A0A9P0DW18_PHYSR|nr:unnamed protein product [Phyllotreta striolata]